MFMTDPDLIYGKNSGQPSVYTGSIHNIEAQEESKKSSEIMKKTGAATVAAAKLTGKATIGAAKTAGNAAAKLTKNAADYLKSDDAAEKMNFLKGKAKSAASGAGSMLSGIRSKASGMIAEQRNKSNDEYTDADNIENIYSDQQYSSLSDTNYDENTVQHEEDVSEYSDNRITENPSTSSVVLSGQASPPDEIRNSPNISRSTPNPVSSGTPGYVIQKQKSNTALIIVIIVLVLIIGILGGMFFMMSRDKKPEDTGRKSPVSESETTETDEEAATKPGITNDSETAEAPDAVVTPEPTETPANNENNYFANYNAPQTGDKIIEMNIQNYGTVKFRLFPEYTDNGVENFIKLAENGYYDGLTFHRVIDDFMIQGGDPLGTGYGGESIWGGMFNAGTDPHLLHLPGAVAYANAGSLDTSGSQFYIVTGDQNITEDTILQYENSGYHFSDDQKNMYIENGGIPYLDGGYTIFGQVFEGLDIVFMIQECSTDSNDKPLDDIIIDSVKVTEYNGEPLKWHINDYDFNDNETPITKYTPEEIKNAAGSDFQFYDQPPYSYSRTIATESDSLNLRAAPSENADIITQIPKGTSVGEFGSNGEWSYISYTVNGDTYVGYVSSQYLN